MSSRNLKVTCIWKSDEFIVFDSQTRPSDGEAYLIIDEPSEKIKVHIPSQFSIVKKRIIERRVQSISKSGFALPKTEIRIGAGFDITITKDDTIPDGLLQVGHHYQYGATSTHVEYIPSAETPQIESSEQEYTPTFLSSEIRGIEGEAAGISEPVGEEIQQSEPQVSGTIVEPQKTPDDDESIAGRFIIALSKTGDVYISRKEDIFSVEYSGGRVEFLVKKGDIEILSTNRIADNDQTLTQAIAEAKRF